MGLLTENQKQYKTIADKVLADLLKRESQRLREALIAGDYPEARGWVKEMKHTLDLINTDLEGRK